MRNVIIHYHIFKNAGTSVADGSKSGSVTITLNAISVLASADNSTVAAGGTAQISAVVSGNPVARPSED